MEVLSKVIKRFRGDRKKICPSPGADSRTKIVRNADDQSRRESTGYELARNAWAAKIQSSVSLQVEDDTAKQMKKILTQKRKHKILTIVKMIFVVSLPVVFLFVMISINLEGAVANRREAEKAIAVMKDIKSLQRLIHCLQAERGSIVRFPDSVASLALEQLQKARLDTDKAISDLSSWPTDMILGGVTVTSKPQFVRFLDGVRARVLNGTEISLEMAFKMFWDFTQMTSAMNRFTNTLIDMPMMNNIWRLFLPYTLFGQAIDFFGEMRILGSLFFNWCYLSKAAYSRLSLANGSFAYLLSQIFSLQYDIEVAYKNFSKEVGFETIFQSQMLIIVENFDGYESCYNKSESERLIQRKLWFSNLTTMINKIISLKDALLTTISQLLDNRTANTQLVASLYTLLFIFVIVAEFILIVLFSTWLNKLLSKMAIFASAIQEKSNELAEEKKRANTLLYQMLPYEVVQQLMRGSEVQAKHYESVTIYFSDIVKFTEISARSSPMQIVDMLNLLYSGFDERIELFEVYKVETIGDAYMVSAGVPKNDFLGQIIKGHARQMAKLALCLLEFAASFVIPHLEEEELLLRIGIHAGSVVAGVVGLKMPRYCLFGDAVNTASRMESHGMAKKIHISQSVKDELEGCLEFKIISRGDIVIKGKGKMQTYWLESIDESTQTDSQVEPTQPDEQAKGSSPVVCDNDHQGSIGMVHI